MKLARALGRTLKELCETMSLDEFRLWRLDYQQNPWGEIRDDIHAAQIQATIANYAGKQRKELASAQEFMLIFKDADKPVDPAQPDVTAHFNQFK